MPQMNPDPFLAEAVAFARDHKPCVIYCNTVAAIHEVVLRLNAMDEAAKAAGITLSMPKVEQRDILTQFEGGNLDYVVMSQQYAYAGGFRLDVANGYFAVTFPAAASRLPQLLSRYDPTLPQVPEGAHYVPRNPPGGRLVVKMPAKTAPKTVWEEDEAKRATLRTTRMLTSAFRQAQTGKHVCVFGSDMNHVSTLAKMLDDIAKNLAPRARAWKNKIWILPFSNANFHGFDWATCQFKDTQSICYVDHYALQYQLRNVRHYLESTKNMANVADWMANTAKALTSLGRKVYMITEDEHRKTRLQALVKDYPQHLTVETSATLGNINWLDLSLEHAHQNCQPLFDPDTVRARFRGALEEINRWDAQ